MRLAKREQLLEMELKMIFGYDFCSEIISRSTKAFCCAIYCILNSLEEMLVMKHECADSVKGRVYIISKW